MEDIRSPFYSDIAYHIQNTMHEKGYTVVLFNSNHLPDLERENINIARHMNCSGIFLISCILDANNIPEFKNPPCPIVLLLRLIKNFEADFVISDNFYGSYLLTNYLVRIGHRQIAYLTGPKNSHSAIRRLEGFKQAAENSMLNVYDTPIFEGDFSFDRGYEFGFEYLDQFNQRPRAVMCANDLMAMGFIEACRESGIQIPEQLSVAGFDDIYLSKRSAFQLTTVHQPIIEICKKSCEIMMRRINGSTEPLMSSIFEPVLMTRKTTA